MEVKVKEIKVGKDEFRKSVDHYWELFRQNVTLPSNGPSVVGFTKSVFEAGFWAGTTNLFGTMTEAIQEHRKATSEHPSNIIGININHDPSKAN